MASSFKSFVLLLGDQTVGKNALVRQYLGHVPPTDQLTKRRIWEKIENIGGNLCPVRLDNLSDLLSFSYLARTARGSLVVFDLTNRQTFTNINVWLPEITKHAKARFVKVVVGNKCDLTNQREVSREEAEQLAASHGMKYFETTATDHESTCGPFQCVLGQLFEARKGMTGLHRAASAGDVQAMHQLVADSPDQIDVLDKYGCSGYHYAAKNGHVNVIEGLVQRGSLLIDAPDKRGWTPMYTAVHFHQGGVINALVRLGSKAIDIPDNNGCTPLHLAAMCGRVEVLEALVRLGSQAIDAPDKYGATPLCRAAEWGDVQVIETLVRLGSKSIDAVDHEGRTLLHHAIGYESKIGAMEVLVLWGSRAIDMLDNSGSTPMKLAINRYNSKAVEALIRLGSRALDHPESFFVDLRFVSDEIQRVLAILGIPQHLYRSRWQADLAWSEEQAGEVRYRVYFSRSLANRLLCATNYNAVAQ